jgi:hypothetical protein
MIAAISIVSIVKIAIIRKPTIGPHHMRPVRGSPISKYFTDAFSPLMYMVTFQEPIACSQSNSRKLSSA